MNSHGLPIQALFNLESQDISDVVMSNMLKIAHIRGYKYFYNTSVDTNVKILTGAKRLKDVIGEENVLSQFCSSGVINLAWEIAGENTNPYVAMVFLKEGKFFLYIASKEDDVGPIVGEYFKFLFKGTPPKKDSVKVAFRYATSQGYQSLTRDIQSPRWNEINDNYPSRINKALNETINSTPPFDNGRLILWHGNPGLGKAQPLSEPIITPYGRKSMGDISIGDEVIGVDGKSTMVTNVWPQGELEIFEVEISDGSTTRTTGEHLWTVIPSGNQPKTITTNQCLDILSSSNKRYLYLPTTKPVEFNINPKLLIDPYLLGLLLGDGGFTANTISFTSADIELVESVKLLIPPTTTLIKHKDRPYTYYIRGERRCKGGNPLIHQLRELGLMGHKSETKFIPDNYLLSSINDRLSLLQGLMDTDGYCHNTREFYSSSSILANQVKELIESLGGTGSIRSKMGSYRTYNGEKKLTRTAYTVTVRLPQQFIPFRLQRKIDKFLTTIHIPPSRKIINITKIGVEKAKCISVENQNGLYLTNNYIVTHNSYAIRALVKHWNTWCKISYIVDPERFFDDPAYAFNVILESNEPKYTPWSALDEFDEDDPYSYDGPPKIKTKNWKLLIIEDADEFLRSDAKIRQGQSLSRLLNIGDGLIGQGLNLMILITTNEKIENIHPAISREGRCFADIEFKPFTFKEANKWLSQHGSNETITEEATLANLYAILNKNKKISVEKELEGVGQYL